MDEYISRNELLKYVQSNVAEAHNERCAQLLEAILNAPTADVVEVVRCKDCVHARNMPLGLCYLHTEPYDNAKGYKGDAVCVEPNNFCSYGERRE